MKPAITLNGKLYTFGKSTIEVTEPTPFKRIDTVEANKHLIQHGNEMLKKNPPDDWYYPPKDGATD